MMKGCFKILFIYNVFTSVLLSTTQGLIWLLGCFHGDITPLVTTETVAWSLQEKNVSSCVLYCEQKQFVYAITEASNCWCKGTSGVDHLLKHLDFQCGPTSSSTSRGHHDFNSCYVSEKAEITIPEENVLGNYKSKTARIYILDGPRLEDVRHIVNSKEIARDMTSLQASVKVISGDKLKDINSTLVPFLYLTVQWYSSDGCTYIERLPLPTTTKILSLSSVWPRVFWSTGDIKIEVNFNTGFYNRSSERVVEVILPIPAGMRLIVSTPPEQLNTPSCIPSYISVLPEQPPPMIFFTRQRVPLQVLLAQGADLSYHWHFSDDDTTYAETPSGGRNSSSCIGVSCKQSNVNHTFETEGFHRITVEVTSPFGSLSDTFCIVAVDQKLGNLTLSLHPDSKSVFQPKTVVKFLVSVTTTNRLGTQLSMGFDDDHKIEAQLSDTQITNRNHGRKDVMVVADYGSRCELDLTIRHSYHREGEFYPSVIVDNGYLRKTAEMKQAVRVYQLLEGRMILPEKHVETDTAVEFRFQIIREQDSIFRRHVRWRLFNQTNSLVTEEIKKGQDMLSWEFRFMYPGQYRVYATVLGPINSISDSFSFTVQDKVSGVTLIPLETHIVRSGYTICFKATYRTGSDVSCSWDLGLNCTSCLQSVQSDLTNCTVVVTFPVAGSFLVSVLAKNLVSEERASLTSPVEVQEEVSGLHVSSNSPIIAGSILEVRVTLLQGSDIRVKLKIPELKISSEMITDHKKTFLLKHRLNEANQYNVTVVAVNNVSEVTAFTVVFVERPFQTVGIATNGCRVTHRRIRLIAVVDDEIPNYRNDLIYFWNVTSENKIIDSGATRRPVFHFTPLSPGDQNVTVVVRNQVVSRTVHKTVPVRSELYEPCLEHDTVAEPKENVVFTVVNLPAGDTVSEIRIIYRDDANSWEKVLLQEFQMVKDSNEVESTPLVRWSDAYPQPGLYHLSVTLIYQPLRSKLTMTSLIWISRSLQSLHIEAPTVVPVYSTGVNTVIWRAAVTPSQNDDVVFLWNYGKNSWWTAGSVVVPRLSSPGNNLLSLKASNGIVMLQVATSVNAVFAMTNLSISSKPTVLGRYSLFEIWVCGSPSFDIVIEFGDGINHQSFPSTYYDNMKLADNRTPPVISLTKEYKYRSVGHHHVIVNVSNEVSWITRSFWAMVEEPISGITMTLLTKPLAAVLEDVVVMVTVTSGTDLKFSWDFGDNSSDYITLKSNVSSSTACHSYGTAGTYNITVNIINDLYEQPIIAYLEKPIQVVEPITQVYLKSSSCVVSLKRNLQKYRDRGSLSEARWTSEPVHFEAHTKMGSDVVFNFDFGDGSYSKVIGMPWIMGHGGRTGKTEHIYRSEGIFLVTVQASNLLGTVNKTMEILVKNDLKNLTLVTPTCAAKGEVVTMRAFVAVSPNENVIYDWKIGEKEILNAGPVVRYIFPMTGEYSVRVSLRNHLPNTDSCGTFEKNSEAAKKIFVLDKLQDVELCVRDAKGGFVCEGEVNIPAKEKVMLRATVVPNNKYTHFLWYLGDSDLSLRTETSVFNHTYENVGSYAVTVLAKNHISNASSSTIKIHVLNKVQNLRIKSSNKIRFGQEIEFMALFWFGSDLTFEWSFGDGTATVTTRSTSVNHTYANVGEYQVKLKAWNTISQGNTSENIFVLKEECEITLRQIVDQSQFLLTEDIIVEIEIDVFCEIHTSILYDWSILQITGNGSFPYDISETQRLHERTLYLLPGTLPVGEHTVTLKVSVNGTILYSKAQTSVSIISGSPVVLLRGGIWRQVNKHNDIVNVNSSMSNVVEDKKDISYKWTCTALNSQQTVCFKDEKSDFTRTNSSSVLTFPTSSLRFRVNDVFIELDVNTGQYESQSSQVISLSEDAKLSVGVICNQCQKKEVSVDEKIVFQAFCFDCDNEDLEYEWNVLLVKDGKHKLVYIGEYHCSLANGSAVYMLADNSSTAPSVSNIPSSRPPNLIQEISGISRGGITQETLKLSEHLPLEDIKRDRLLPRQPIERDNFDRNFDHGPESSVHEENYHTSTLLIDEINEDDFEDQRNGRDQSLGFREMPVVGFSSNVRNPHPFLLQEGQPGEFRHQRSRQRPNVGFSANIHKTRLHLLREGLPGEEESTYARHQGSRQLPNRHLLQEGLSEEESAYPRRQGFRQMPNLHLLQEGLPEEEESLYPRHQGSRQMPNLPLLQKDLPEEGSSYLQQQGSRQIPNLHLLQEGLPGEEGSAYPRHQAKSIPRSEYDGRRNSIREGTSKGRPLDGNSGFIRSPQQNTTQEGNPVQSDINHPQLKKPLSLQPREKIGLKSNHSATGLRSKYLVLRPGVLHIGSTYLVELGIKRKGSEHFEGRAMESVTMGIGPVNGRCTIVPPRGDELRTFSLHCMEWKTDHRFLFYELSYSLTPNSPHHLIYNGLSKEIKFILPAGLPSHNYNVYLDVVIRDGRGIGTKVCSTERRVVPIRWNHNSTRDSFIYNTTFDIRSSFNKLVGEKDVQGYLHQIHVLANSLNNNILPDPTHRVKRSAGTSRNLRKKIRNKFIHLVGNLHFFTKVEIIQGLSALGATLHNPEEVTIQGIELALNITKRAHTKFNLYCNNSQMWCSDESIMIVLAELIHAASHCTIQNKLNKEEVTLKQLVSSAQYLLHHRLKEHLRSQVPYEEPYTFTSPMLSTLCGRLWLKLFDPVVLHIEQMQLALSASLFHQLVNRPRIPHCTAFFIEAYNFSPFFTRRSGKEPEKVVVLSLFKCNENKELILPNKTQKGDSLLTVQFPKMNKENKKNISRKFMLVQEKVNLHKLNVTKELLNYTLLIFLECTNEGSSQTPLEVIFSLNRFPSSNNYIYRQKTSIQDSTLKIFVPAGSLTEIGTYYLTVLESPKPMSFWRTENPKSRTYTLDLSWQQCVQWKNNTQLWSFKTCHTEDSQNINVVKCRCSLTTPVGFYLYVPTSVVMQIPLDDLFVKSPHPAPVIVLLVITVVFVVLIVILLTVCNPSVKCLHFFILNKNDSPTSQQYLVTIATGSFWEAGTTSQVCLVLHGDKWMSETKQLLPEEHENFIQPLFLRGSLVSFVVSTAKPLGQLWKVQVWHNNSGSSPSWYLKDITVTHLNTNETFCFTCEQWLSVEEDDGQVEREIPVCEQSPSFWERFYQQLMENLNNHHMWNSIFYHSPCSTYTSIERLACCLSEVLTGAFLTALWCYYSVDQNYDIFLVKDLSPEQVLYGFKIAVAMVIPHQCLTVLFHLGRRPLGTFPNWLRVLWTGLSENHIKLCHKYKLPVHSEGDSSSSSYTSSIENMDSSEFWSSEVETQEDDDEESYSDDENTVRSTSCESRQSLSPLEESLSQLRAIESWAQSRHRHGEYTKGKASITSQPNSLIDVVNTKRRSSLLEQLIDDTSATLRSLRLRPGTNKKQKCETQEATCDSSNSLHSDQYTSEQTSSGFEDWQPEKEKGTAELQSEENTSENISKSFKKNNLAYSYSHVSVLPSWVHYIGWEIILVSVFSSLYYTPVYTLWLNPLQVLCWLQTYVISLLCAAFIIYPLWVCLLSLLKSIFEIFNNHKTNHHLCGCCRNDLQKMLEMKENVDTTTSEQQVNPVVNDKEACNRQHLRYLRYLRPPPESALIESRLQAQKARKFCFAFRGILRFVTVLLILVVVAYGGDLSSQFYLNNSVKQACLRNGLYPLKHIKTWANWWDWTQHELLSSFYPNNYKPDPSRLDFPTGSVLVEQPRLHLFQDLSQPFSKSLGLGLKFGQQLMYYGHSSQWSVVNYNSSWDTQKLWGQHSTYWGGSDVVSLSLERNQASIQLQQLRNSSWLNRNTRAVSVEFLLYNPVFSLFTSVVLLTEFPPSGGVTVVPFISSTRLHNYVTPWDHCILACEFLLFLIIGWTMKQEVWHMLKQRKQYWSDPWNVIKVVFLMVGIVYIVCYIYRYVLVKEAMYALRKGSGYSLPTFIRLAEWNQIIQGLTGLLIFIHLISSISLLKLNTTFKKSLYALRTVSKQMFLLGGLYLFLVIGYSFLSPLVSGSGKTIRYHPLLVSLTLVEALLNRNKSEVTFDTQTPWGQVITLLLVCGVFVIFFFTFSLIRVILIAAKRTTKTCEGAQLTVSEVPQLFRNLMWSLLGFSKSESEVQKKIEQPSVPTEFLLFELEGLVDNLLERANKLYYDHEDFLDFAVDDDQLVEPKNDTSDEMERLTQSNIDCSEPKHFNLAQGQQKKWADEDSVSSYEPMSSSASSGSQVVTVHHHFPPTNLGKPQIKVYPAVTKAEKRSNQLAVETRNKSILSHQGSKVSFTSNQSRVRKTKTFQFQGSTSSLESNSLQQTSNKEGFMVRKTKSRGKGKNKELILDSNVLENFS
ncbi:uncharacterized protein LOC143246519 isoform X3 [Tachypleus tridentatus]|uniref:uncharacterized protein LOC143246519 isoform X3 n=1 Tax=Tachypleus tridentatus TaxID=6853 RepID=UPI003FD3C76A